MTDTANRVLSLDEVMALEEDREVYVEFNRAAIKQAYGGRKELKLAKETEGICQVSKYSDGTVRFSRAFYVWNVGLKVRMVDYEPGDERFLRVWSLPQPPTQEEMDAWPWPERVG